jgi:hypothetical protein
LHVSLELYSADDISAFGAFMVQLAERVRANDILPDGTDPLSPAAIPASIPTPAAEEPAKKTRGKAAPKAEPAAETVAEAPKEEPKVEAKPEEPPAITFDEIKALIIDALNDWTDAAKEDPEIRVKKLKPILSALGAEKLSQIDPSKFNQVQGLVDESRKELAEFLEQRSAED